jgi:hypothetical protein
MSITIAFLRLVYSICENIQLEFSQTWTKYRLTCKIDLRTHKNLESPLNSIINMFDPHRVGSPAILVSSPRTPKLGSHAACMHSKQVIHRY